MLHANQPTTSLERAIAAAEAFMVKFGHVSAEHTAAEVAIPRQTEAGRAAIKAAEDAVEPPTSLWFERAPKDRIVEMTMVWGDGSRKEITEPTPERFVPEDLAALKRACEAAGIAFAPRLKDWKDWTRRRLLAGQAARPAETVAAETRFEQIEERYEEMLSRRDKVGARILSCKVKTAADATRQTEAYLKLMESDADRLKDLFEEDKNLLLANLIGTIRRLAETSNVIPLKRAA